MSLAMKAVAVYLRLAYKPTWADAGRMMKRVHGPKGDPQPPALVRSRHLVRERLVQGFRCFTIIPRAQRRRQVVMYVHGGGYISEIKRQHWSLISRLADAGVSVEVPIYGLAPQHSFREAYALLTEVYRALVEECGAETVTFMGDSAGGGLALGFAQILASAGLPAPRSLTLISPWLDLTCSNPEIDSLAAKDPWLAKAGALVAGEFWAAGTNRADPRLSPLNGDSSRLPPIDVYTGTHDILYPDIIEFHRRAQNGEPSIELTVCQGACHVYPLLPVPEGRQAADRIVARASAVDDGDPWPAVGQMPDEALRPTR